MTPTPTKYILLQDMMGGLPIQIPVVPIAPNSWQLLQATIASLTNQNLLTDAQLAGVNTAMASEQLLSTTPLVNLNTATPTGLFTVPTGKSCIITRVVLKAASISLSTVSMCFGFVGAGYNDNIATATHVELTGPTLYTSLSPKTGALIGTAAQVFTQLNTTPQGVAATCTIDVHGYTF